MQDKIHLLEKKSYLFYKVNYKILILKQDIKNVGIEKCQIGTRCPTLKSCIHLPFCPLQNVTGWSILSASSIAKPSRVNLLICCVLHRWKRKFPDSEEGEFARTSYLCSSFLMCKLPVQRHPALHRVLAQLSSTQLFCMQAKAQPGAKIG